MQKTMVILNINKHIQQNSEGYLSEKCVLSLIAIALLLCSVPVMAADTKVTVDGKPVVFDVEPVVIEGYTLVPLRAIVESLGAEVGWTDETKQITITKDGMVNTLFVDKATADKTLADGSKSTISLAVSLKIIDGRVMVPARYIAESLGAKVDWIAENRTVVISTIPAGAASAHEDPTSQSQASTSPTPTPTQAPKLNTYSGTGDDVIQISSADSMSVLYIEGNQESRHFAVKGLDENDKSTGLFVNTTAPYKGITLDAKASTRKLAISATGEWKIEVRPTSSCRTPESGQTISGNGDEVILINGGSSLRIEGNSEAGHFAVKAYNDAGKYDLPVKTTDAYNGKVMLKNKPVLLEVVAVGKWSISVE